MADSTHLEWLEHYRINREVVIPGSRRQLADSWIRGERIGTGAYGAVYVENNARTGKVSAVKEIWKIYDEQEFSAELIALTRLSKPAYEEYFVRFLGWYKEKTSISLTMEYLEHGDLRKHMLGPFSERQAREVTSQLFLGLEAMHRDGFTHRDLKPENIFVAQKEPSYHIKIGDFGISKRISDENNTNLFTRVGKPNYMAPEVLQLLPEVFEPSNYDNKVDVWAAGIILYEMLCAKRPFSTQHSLSQYCCAQLDFPEAAIRARKVTQAGCNLTRLLITPQPSDHPNSDFVLESEWFDLEGHNMTDFRGENIHSREPVSIPQRDKASSPSVASDSTSPHQSLQDLSTISRDTTARISMQNSSTFGKDQAFNQKISNSRATSDTVPTRQSIRSEPLGEENVEQSDNISIDPSSTHQADKSHSHVASHGSAYTRQSALNSLFVNSDDTAIGNQIQQNENSLEDAVFVDEIEKPPYPTISSGSGSDHKLETGPLQSTGQSARYEGSSWRAYPLHFPKRSTVVHA